MGCSKHNLIHCTRCQEEKHLQKVTKKRDELEEPHRELQEENTKLRARLPGTMSDAQIWDAFAEELRLQFKHADLVITEVALLATIRAVEQIAKRIRGET
jgi:hypothetical protein